MTEEDVIFDAEEDIENWEPVETGSSEDFNDYDLHFIDKEDMEEGAQWVGEYTGTRKIGKAENPSCIFDNHKEEMSYAFTDHATLKTKLADTKLSENQTRAENPVEVGETVAVIYNGTQPVEGRPMDMHLWEIRRPPK